MITAISNIKRNNPQGSFVKSSKNNNLPTQVSFTGNWTKLGKDFFDNGSNTKNIAEKIIDHTSKFVQKIFGRDELPFSERPMIARTSMDPESHRVNPSISDGTETLSGKIEKSVATTLGKEDEYDSKLINNQGKENATRLDHLVQDSQNEIKSHETNPANLVFDQDGNVVFDPAKDAENNLSGKVSDVEQDISKIEAPKDEEIDLSKIVFGPDGEPVLDENGIPIQEIEEVPDDVAINADDASDDFGSFDDIDTDSDISCDDF